MYLARKILERGEWVSFDDHSKLQDIANTS
jgi:hypothetical protein